MATASLKTNMDMLNGPLGGKILRFALPLAATSILQQLFNAADIAVVGQFAGDKALAAVGANTFVINLLINLFVGISVGVNVVVANSIGAHSYRSVTRSVHTSVIVSFFSGILLSFVGIFFARPILTAVSTPLDILDMAVRYLQIYFAGMPFVMMFNFIAAILRGKGDTKRPLYVLMVAGAVNVVLNFILVAGFDLGVSGVAIATVCANAISGLTLFYFLLHEVGPFKLEFWKLRVTPLFLSRIMRVGLPSGLRGVVFSFSTVCLQSAINSLGSATVAASAAALNYEFVVYYWLNSFSQACVTFVGQNYGAKNMPRCRSAVRWTLLLGCSSTIVLSALLYICPPLAFGVYVGFRDHRNRFYSHVRGGRDFVYQCLFGCVFERTFWNGPVACSCPYLRGGRVWNPNSLGILCVPQVQFFCFVDGDLPDKLDCDHLGSCGAILLLRKASEVLETFFSSKKNVFFMSLF